MTDVSVFAQIRGSVRQYFSSAQAEIQPMLGDGGELISAEGLPPLTEIVRLGNSWHAIASAGVAALTALPTTTSTLSLNNKDTATGKSFVIESFGSIQGVIDATQQDTMVLLAMNNRKTSAQASAGTLQAATQVASLSGKGSYGGVSELRSGATVVNDVWVPHQTIGIIGPTLVGDVFRAIEVNARGLYIVPPGGCFSIAIVKSAAAAAAQQFPFIRWHEVQLNLG